MSNFVKIQGKDSLARDLTSKAIINTSTVDYENYMNKRRLAQQAKDEAAKQAEEINNIKSELTEIKQMLLALLNNK